MTELVVDWCSSEAATWAVTRWHYSQVMPTGKLVKIGAWEDGRFIGCVVYSRGASPYLGRAYNLDATEVCELTRVALTTHETPVSQIVAESLKMLRTIAPNLRLVVSFADTTHGHHGGIYQAGNWIYTGRSNEVQENYVRGRWRHVRGSYHETKRANGTVPTRSRPGKHRYVMPLDRAMRRQVTPLALPYPRGSSLDGETAPSPGARAGSTPAIRSN